MTKKKWLVLLIVLCGLFFASGCVAHDMGNDSINGAGNVDNADDCIRFVTYTKYDVGEVEKEGEIQEVRVGEKTTLRAIDTEEYTFLHWELLIVSTDSENKIVSTDREYVLQPTEGDLNFRYYYAVFAPKDENKALVNVLCKKGETMQNYYLDSNKLQISGGGYYTIGDIATLRSTVAHGVGVVRTFAYDNGTVDGPVLNLPVEKNITVVATLERMVAITMAESEQCTLTLQSEDNFFEESEVYQVTMEMNTEEYVPDVWRMKDAITGEVLFELPWEGNTVWDDMVLYRDISLHNELLIELICTNENLIDTLPVEIISATGDAVKIEFEQPKKMILGRGYPIWVKPDENTYIQEIYQTAPATEDFPYKSKIDFHGVQDIYSEGGEVYVPDPTPNYGEGCKVVMKAIPREKAALVNIISDDDFIWEECQETGKKPSSYYAPMLSTNFIVVEKNKETIFQLDHYNNLYAIYEVGYQFSRVEDENGNKVADNLQFLFTVGEDTNYYIKWTKKPVFDRYFDYTLTEDGTGYVAEVSQLAINLGAPLSAYVTEMSLPAVYNGKPVKEIADYGMSQYRCYPTKLGLDYYTVLPFKKIILPDTIEKIGKKAFAGCFSLQVVLPQEDRLSYISPDAFWAPNDVISVNLSEKHLGMILQTLHSIYIGENENFTYKMEEDSHFTDADSWAHYEALTEYVCIKESAFVGKISAFELGTLYHEFFHHYQIVATMGVGEETLETMKIKPTNEEIDGWKQPYDKTDYEAYWNHPMEVSARAFAQLWSGLVLT